MSVSYKAFLVAGISLEDFFRKVGEKTETFDEYDKKGNKTGKQFTETKIIATLPDGNEVEIGKMVAKFPVYDFYSSISFDGDFSDQTFLGLHWNNYETRELLNKVIGSIVLETYEVKSVNIDKMNKIILEVRDELKEKFGYDGIVKLYLINYVSY
jgi:hypothetical protein